MKKKTKILIIMSIAMLFGYLPWYNFSAVLNFIVEDFNLSAAQIGYILASIQVGYMIIVIFSGWLSDKIGEIKVVTWATLLTGIFSLSFVWFARNFYSILVLRLLTGLSAGAIYVPGIAYLSRWFKSSERGKAIGIYTAALTASYAGGYFIASPLASKYGWEVGITWTSLPAFLAFLLLLIIINKKPPEEDLTDNIVLSDSDSENMIKPAPEGGYSGPVVITVSYMGHMWELYAFWGWIGPFLVASSIAVGYEESMAVALGGNLAALVIILGVPAVSFCGVLADKLGRTKLIIIAALCSLIAELFLGFLYGHSLIIIVLISFWIGFWVIADSPIYKAGLTEMVSSKIRSTALGLQSAIGYVMTIISPIIFGQVLEFQNGKINPVYADKWGVAFCLLGLGALVAPVAALILRRLPQAKLMAKGKM